MNPCMNFMANSNSVANNITICPKVPLAKKIGLDNKF